jgi:hypothetical protein
VFDHEDGLLKNGEGTRGSAEATLALASDSKPVTLDFGDADDDPPDAGEPGLEVGKHREVSSKGSDHKAGSERVQEPGFGLKRADEGGVPAKKPRLDDMSAVGLANGVSDEQVGDIGTQLDIRDIDEEQTSPWPSRKRVRFNLKSSACPHCHGPCGSEGCAEGALGDTQATAKDHTSSLDAAGSGGNDAADAFARARAARMRATSEAASAAQVAPPNVQLPTRPGKRRIHRDLGLLNFGKVPAWLANDPTIGGARVHSTHRMGWHRGMVWCWECGVYATAVPINLKTECDGATLAGQKNLSRFRQGQPPSKAVWPLPL